MSHVFVSHATADDQVVSKIHDALEAAGIPAWVDHEDELQVGGNWSKGVQTALNDCRAGLFVLSSTSAKSLECEAEYRRVLLLGKILYVALIEPVSKADFPWRLTTIQYVNLQADFTAGMAHLIRAIEGERGLDPASPTIGQANLVSGAFPRWHLDVPLIGRDVELAETQKSLNEGRRATMILGLGGIGKTRLAAEIVSGTEFRDGAVWQTIAPHTSLSHLTLLLRDHLGLPQTSEADAIWSALGAKEVLIVLDNAEDCAMPAAYAERINALDLSGGTRVLLTSRAEWPDLHGKTRVTLKAPDPAAAVSILNAMVKYEKPALWESGHEADIAQAARYHPRLMWYAVRWTDDVPPRDALDMLNTLQGADAEAALDDVVRKTVKRMTEQPGGEAAYAALRKLAVCRGGFTLEAAQAIAGETDSLKLLRRWGLVTSEGQRYSLDPLVIAAVGEDPDAHRPHYAYYLALAKQHDKKQDYLELDIESANLEAAFEWAIGTGDGEGALWLANACAQFIFYRGRFAQILEWHGRVVKALVNHPDKLLWSNAQNSLGNDYQSYPLGNKRENLKQSIAAHEAALLYRTPEAAPLDHATTQNNLGNAYRDLSRIEEREVNLKRAVAAYEAALVYWTPQTAPLHYAAAQNNLGASYQDFSDIEEREVNLKRSIAAFEAALLYWTPQTAPMDYAITQNNLGPAYRNLAQIEEREANLKRAAAAYEAALVYWTPQTAPLYYAMIQGNFGNLYKDMGNLVAVISCCREAERYFRQMGYVADADDMLREIADAEAELRGSS